MFMTSSAGLPNLFACTTALLVAALSVADEKPGELTRTRANLKVARGEAAQAVPPKPRQPAKPTFVIHG
jgi:hypothetical protein